jgi:hypothetical protein
MTFKFTSACCSGHFCSLLVVADAMPFYKEEMPCTQWCHTGYSGAENDMFICEF